MHVRQKIGLAGLLLGLILGAPLSGQESVTVVAGDYSAGWLKRLFFGSDYRDLWTTPIRVPYLDLHSYGGGLTPDRTGGYGQTISLHFRLEIQRAKEVAEAATKQLQVANAELARAATAKDEFLSSMSHELRTPLNAVLSLSESMLEGIYGEVNERQAKTVGMIESSGRHLLSLINDILDLSKVAAGKMELSIGTVDVEAVCKASLLFVRERAMKKGVKLKTSHDPRVRTVQADERRLKQMLVNLLTNAVKFTDEGTVGLDVQCDTGNGELKFVVSDTGIGIASDDLEKLFAPFTQLESGLDRQYEGTGLGLSLVTRMAEMHGGRVTAESEGRGHGSRFVVTLPWTPEEQPEAVAEIRGATREELSPAVRKVIIVEDDPTVSKQLRRYMEELDAEVLALPHGTGVITQAETFQPDVPE